MKTTVLSLLAFLPFFLFAQENLNVSNNLALEGYDAVSYFNHAPLKGKKEFTSTYQHVNYHFSTAANKAVFDKNPSAYLPQYGGWCAYAMGANGEKVEVDPETYKILDGKLYLFYNAFFNNTLEKWNKNEKVLKAKADANWNKLTHK